MPAFGRCSKNKEVTMRQVATPPASQGEKLSARRPRPVRYVPPLQLLFGFFRHIWPIPHIWLPHYGRWGAVTLRDDVEEVLSRPDIFTVPYASEMTRLTDGSPPGTPFILAMDDPARHDEQLVRVMKVFRRSDAVGVGETAYRNASAIVRQSNGRLDAVRELITGIPLDICESYLGVPIPDRRSIAEALVWLSWHLFGVPPIVQNDHVDELTNVLRDAVDNAIRAERKLPVDPNSKTVIGRLMATEPRDSEVRAFLIGLITGFVPTNTIAGGHILELLLNHPGMLKAACAAAQAGDDILLWQCLFEALRYNPINLGPFRLCEQDYVIAANTRHRTRIRAGTTVLASTMSAMFDCTRVDKPYVFTPSRPGFDRLHFGFGMHWCLGAFVAQAQLTQTFKALLLQPGLERARGPDGRMQNWPKTLFPQHLVVQFQVKTP
jgi:cytochrome P450